MFVRRVMRRCVRELNSRRVAGLPVGSVLTASTTGAICLGLSISTAGVGGLACGLVVVAAGSLGAGLLGGEAGEEVGDIIYEYMQ